jgi:hypothetical protein
MSPLDEGQVVRWRRLRTPKPKPSATPPAAKTTQPTVPPVMAATIATGSMTAKATTEDRVRLMTEAYVGLVGRGAERARDAMVELPVLSRPVLDAGLHPSLAV